jgi:hypothetical protein
MTIESVASLPPVAGRFRMLMLDPPWVSGCGREFAHETMTQEQLLHWEVSTQKLGERK